jgi:hypothetical protein
MDTKFCLGFRFVSFVSFVLAQPHDMFSAFSTGPARQDRT